MIKDTIMAILAGISIAQRITPPWHSARVAVVLTVAIILLKLYDLWDKRLQIIQLLRSITGAISTGLFLIRRRGEK